MSSIYFIGNSVTDTINYSGLEKLAKSQNRQITWGRHMIPGAPLQWIWQHPSQGYQQPPFGFYPNALANYSWDMLSLQPFDRPLVVSPGDVNGGDIDFGSRFIGLLQHKSKTAAIYIYQRWMRRTQNENNTASSWNERWLRPYSGKVGEWGNIETRSHVDQLLKALRSQFPNRQLYLVPVGDVLFELNRRMAAGQIPGYASVWQFYTDQIHLNNVGSYVVACTYYATLFRATPVGLPVPAEYGAISPQLAQTLQQAVWAIVQTHPNAGLSGAGPTPAPTPTPTPTPTPMPTPSPITPPGPVSPGNTFRIVGRDIIDPKGNRFVPIGVNSAHAWNPEAFARGALATEIQKSGANSVRIVTGGNAWTWQDQGRTAGKKRELLDMALAAKLVPVIEIHDGTCVDLYDRPVGNNKAGLKQIVDNWLEPEHIALLRQYQDRMILNIANEWGPNSTVWRDGYIESVRRLRAAGYQGLIMIDAGGNCGQNPFSIISWGREVFNADPLKNICFSIHMYSFWTTPNLPHDRNWQWSCGTRNDNAPNVFQQLLNTGLPLVCGEFAWRSEQDSRSTYDPRRLVEEFNRAGVGWYYWAWYSNEGVNHWNMVTTKDLKYNFDNDLTEAGRFLSNDPTYGMKAIARRCSIFT